MFPVAVRGPIADFCYWTLEAIIYLPLTSNVTASHFINTDTPRNSPTTVSLDSRALEDYVVQ